MVTRNEIVFDIFEQLRAHIADDDDIDRRQIEAWVKDYRADFLKQRFDREPFNINEGCKQYLQSLSVEKVDSSSVSGFTSGRYLMKTVKSIPNTIKRNGRVGTLTHIGSADKLNESFTIATYEKAIKSGNSRFNRDEIFAFPYNGYIYIYSKGDAYKTIYNIDIQGVFEDPQEAFMVTAASGYNYSGDENFYTPRDIKKYIVTTILQEKYGINVNPPADEDNDSIHKLEEEQQRRR